MRARKPVLAWIAAMAACGASPAVVADTPTLRNIQLTARHLYGPGPLPDQDLAQGHVHNMHFVRFMRATVPGSNNGGAPPNVSGEALQGTPIDGTLSDGTLINENIDMGHALLLQGRFNLLLAATHGGPHRGNSEFFLDEHLNWTIRDDIAIDPGFAEGLIKIHEFQFTSGPTFVPYSLQTQRKHPGGVDMVGSLRSGEVLFGRVGDDNLDGHVDGIWMALGTFPLDSILLPGAPFVQSIEFESDIPIDAADAAMLSLAAARNRLQFLREHELEDAAVARLTEGAQERVSLSMRQLEKAISSSACTSQCRAIRQRVASIELGEASHGAAQAIAALDTIVRDLVGMHEARHGRLKTGL